MPSPRHLLLAVGFAIALLTANSDAYCKDCVEAQNCPMARASIRMYGGHTLPRCGWNGLIEKVCCTADALAATSMSGEDVSIWDYDNEQASTAKPNKPRGTLRKSDAECENFASQPLFTVNWHILGGEDAEMGEFPHMVALGYPDVEAMDATSAELQWNCAGSLISERYVLTAAHCVLRSKPTKALVGAINVKNRTADSQAYDIENITMHPGYVRRTGTNDLALVRIARVTITDLVFPACLYQKPTDPVGLVITGWGKIYLGQETRADTLQKARVKAVNMDVCNATYIQRMNRPLGPGQICAGADDTEHPTDSCQGDSGGPLQVLGKKTYDIVGIVSFGLTDCGGNAPSVYTRVSNYLDWIEDIVWP